MLSATIAERLREILRDHIADAERGILTDLREPILRLVHELEEEPHLPETLIHDIMGGARDGGSTLMLLGSGDVSLMVADPTTIEGMGSRFILSAIIPADPFLTFARMVVANAESKA